ncbi:glutamate synthase subunit beta [Paenibacillus sp. GP183]|uniref:NAD(P)/FAD-dependent oxidoreductase n=1 Tax=Paenibacillus sp. GP183 TaxID=1882751 RepID=UPI00089CAC24|nr:glutamate synthase subunit beta [Paenibacillus sp. GP183]SEC18055.1 2-polyprenyl-6-methoxyphenol hydroxylase [Paenibacillus sp. GP183]
MFQRGKAIVIGGGIAGKLTARVLSEFFQEVVILESDKELKGPMSRKGAPQGKHLHALLHAGEYGLESLYPGITNKMLSSGAIKIDSTKDLAWFHHGVWKLRYGGEYTSILQTRPHLEWHIEQCTKEIPNVSFRYNQIVANYLINKEGHQIYGVEVKDSDSKIEAISADLIIDASGVSSFSSRWLGQNGYIIPEEKVHIGLTYVSKLYNLPENKRRDWYIKLIYPNPSQEKIGGTISRIEGNSYICTLIGYQNEIQETEIAAENGFLKLSQKLPALDIYNELKEGVALSEESIYKVPHIAWKRLDKVKNLPNGLLLIGDAVCRIDPVFGQGMSIAVLQVLALQKQFQMGKDTSLPKIITSSQKKFAQIIYPVWNMVISEDYRFPDMKGQKPLGLSIKQWFVKKIYLLSSHDQRVYSSFIKVMNLVQPATILFHPSVILKVIKQAIFKKGN